MAEAVAKRLDKLLVAATVVRVVADVLLAQVDLLMPFSPDFGGCEHATRSTLVTERGLTGSVCTTTRDTGNTSDSTTCVVVRNPSVSFFFATMLVQTHLCPRTRLKSVHLPSHSRHMVVSCSWPFQCGRFYIY